MNCFMYLMMMWKEAYANLEMGVEKYSMLYGLLLLNRTRLILLRMIKQGMTMIKMINILRFVVHVHITKMV